MTRELLLSLFLVGVVGTGLGLTTMGAFTDSDSSGSNSIQADTLNMTVDGGDSADSAFSISGGVPGDTTSHTYDIRNAGSVAADHVEIDVSFSENDGGRTEPGDTDLDAELNATEMASLVRVQTFEYQNDNGNTLTNIKSSATDDNGNGIIDLQDLQDTALPADDLTAPQTDGGNTTKLVVDLKLASDDSGSFSEGGNTAGSLTGSDEDMMADGVDVTVTVTLNQDASQ